MRTWKMVGGLVVVILLAGCKSQSSTDSTAAPAAAVTVEKPLYDRLGGDPAIRAVVDDFTLRALADPKVNFRRTGTPKEWHPTGEQVSIFKTHLVQFIEMNTGGPQTYEGRDMKSVHAGMMITNAEFDALAGDLAASLDKFNVPAREKAELLTVVGSTRGQIVENPEIPRIWASWRPVNYPTKKPPLT